VVYQTGSIDQLVNVLNVLRAGKQDVIRKIYVLHNSVSSDALSAFHNFWGARFVPIKSTFISWYAALMAIAGNSDCQTILLIDGSITGMTEDLAQELTGWIAHHPEIAWASAIAMNADGTVYEAGRVVASDYRSAPMFSGSSLFSFSWFGGPLWYRNARAASPYAVAMSTRHINSALSILDGVDERTLTFAEFCSVLVGNERRGLIDPFARVYFDKPPELHWSNDGQIYHSDPYFNPAFSQVSPLRLKA
jgi:hypothetical protein